MIFGLVDEKEEDIASKLGDVFEELREKPRVQACRVQSWGCSHWDGQGCESDNWKHSSGSARFGGK